MGGVQLTEGTIIGHKTPLEDPIPRQGRDGTRPNPPGVHSSRGVESERVGRLRELP
jgi:hypothetical protein